MSDQTIYFVSDLHLGDKSGADRFRYPTQLMGLLDRIEKEPQAHLVLLGDFLELWAASLEGVMIHYAPLLQALIRFADTHPITYVVGNHDCLPWYYFIQAGLGNVRVVERFTGARGNLVALHGHQFDPLNSVNVGGDGTVKAPWTRKLVQVLGFLERIGGQKTGDVVDDIGGWLVQAQESLDRLLPDWDEGRRQDLSVILQRTKEIFDRQSPGERGYPEQETAYEEGARSLLRNGAQFVVMGHTHHPVSQDYGSRRYVNTGSWVWDRYPPTYARFNENRLELLSAEDHHPYRP